MTDNIQPINFAAVCLRDDFDRHLPDAMHRDRCRTNMKKTGRHSVCSLLRSTSVVWRSAYHRNSSISSSFEIHNFLLTKFVFSCVHKPRRTSPEHTSKIP